MSVVAKLRINGGSEMTAPPGSGDTSASVVITGGFSGFGAALARRLLDYGAPNSHVTLIDRKPMSKAREAIEIQLAFGDKRVLIIADIDVADYASFEGAFLKAKRKFGKVTGVVNNAGVGDGPTIFNGESTASSDAAVWKKTIDVDLLAVAFGCGLALRHGEIGCRVVNVASLAGILPMAIQPVYSAAKAGVIALTRSVAMCPEAQRRSVIVTCICPGLVQTNLVARGLDEIDGFKDVLSSAGTIPIELVTEGMLRLLVAANCRPGQTLIVSSRQGLIDYGGAKRSTTTTLAKL